MPFRICVSGVRPNSPVQTTSVSSSRPRPAKSVKSAAIGFSLTFTGGLGWTKVDYPAELGSDTNFTWNLGMGLEVGLGPLTADVGPRLWVINTDGGASRKHLGLVAGVSYFFN